ncbi:neuraminidase-like domain-containing protein [Runella limosa]|uniref:neuraminidase-like domain-containing protein n=1 Tax=Runella limosa TaxID=370978 RepID=UPI000400EF60|nr:neuraminidase-like domain-containing protein [Runella limosa]
MPENPIIKALHINMQGEEVKKMQNDLARIAKVTIPTAESDTGFFGIETTKAVLEFQKVHNLATTGVVDAITQQKITEVANGDNLRKVTGAIALGAGVATQGLKVVAYDKSIGGQAVPLGEATLNPDGTYILPYTADKLGSGKTQADIEIRLVDVANAGNVYASSGILYNSGKEAAINMAIPSAKLPQLSEYQQLTQELQQQLGAASLKDMIEDEQRQDISYLANKTGWDARMVAMAVQAQKESAATGLPAEYYYAMYRTGISLDSAALHQVQNNNAEAIWKKAIDANIIQATPAELIKSKETFSNASITYYLDKNPTIGVSSFKDILKTTAVSEGKQVEFAQFYYEYGTDRTKFWDDAKMKFGDFSDKIQLHSKLAFLTLNNAPLIERLNTEVQNLGSPVDLVKNGFYKPQKWESIVADNILPKDVSKADYANMMANELRLAYPTAVFAEQIKEEVFNLRNKANKQATYQFLSDNHEKFIIGVDSVKSFEQDHGTIADAEVRKELKHLTTLYQVSPNDKVMEVLAAHKLNSARLIVQYSKAEFVAKFAEPMGGKAIAELTHSKAQSITSLLSNVHTTILKEQATIPLTATTAPSMLFEDPIAKSIRESITMEELFGSLDFCDCESCQSIFSPAAYLVDILKFLDLKKIDSDGNEVLPRTYNLENPIDVLLERRPDIEHLELTCENTNTVLPYLDIVNEILEYWVAKNHDVPTNQVLTHLKDFKGNNTVEGETMEELLAKPKFVDSMVYDTILSKPVYPSPLPFNFPLVALRQYYDNFKIPLAKAMEALRKDDSPTTWEAVYTEQLGISPETHKILTDHNAHKLGVLFGEAEDITIAEFNAKIANARSFTRKMGISFSDLVTILKSTFINPAAKLIPLLEKLDINFEQMKALKEGSITFGTLNITADVTLYGGDIEKWLKDNYDATMSLILLTGTDKDFGKLELKYALPDTTKNALKEDDYVRLYRFIRVWKITGWTVQEADVVFSAFYDATKTLDEGIKEIIIHIAQIKRLQELLKLRGKAALSELVKLLSPDSGILAKKTLLAKQLKLKEEELDTWITFTGIDPFAKLGIVTPPMADFVNLLQLFKQNNIKLDLLKYLLKHEDTVGKWGLKADKVASICRELKGTLSKIELENTLRGNIDENQFVERMKIAYGDVLTNRFINLIKNKKRTFSTEYDQADDNLVAGLTGLLYNPAQKTLSWAGFMSNAQKTTLDNAANRVVEAAQKTKLKDAIQLLFDLSTTEQAEFEKEQTAFEKENAFLKSALQNMQNAAKLFEPDDTTATSTLAAISVDIKKVLKKRAIQQWLMTSLGIDAEIATLLLEDKDIANAANQTALEVVQSIENLELGTANDLLEFYMEVPQNDSYNFYIKGGQGKIIINQLEHLTEDSGNGFVYNSDKIDLKAGQLYHFQVAVTAGEKAKLFWSSMNMAKVEIPANALYAPSTVGAIEAIYTKLFKVNRLINTLSLSATEVSFFAKETIYLDSNKSIFNALEDKALATAVISKYLKNLRKVIVYQEIKRACKINDDELVRLMKHPDETAENSSVPLLTQKMAWLKSEKDTLLTYFGKGNNDLKDSILWSQLHQVMQLQKESSISISNLISWTKTNPKVAEIDTISDTLEKTYEANDWLDTLKPINDGLRMAKRDALVAFILQKLSTRQETKHINSANKLFEFFLIDVEMSSCMKTSRLRQAISTVQLFVQRCLMNLEKKVSPDSINTKRWEWMRRYRLWEANRKIYIYPENWLEPELRLDKSSIFRDLEGSLLQADINDEMAEKALYTYLEELDHIAKLEIVGMYMEEQDPNTQNDDIIHVIGRTNGESRRYYYRRYEYGYWTAWEIINLDIENTPVLPVIWRNRLFLFWLNVIPKGEDGKPVKVDGGKVDGSVILEAKSTIEINLSWSEYYKGKWQPRKTSNLNEPMKIKGVSRGSFNRDAIQLRSSLSSSFETNGQRHLNISLNLGDFGGAFELYNTHTNPIILESLSQTSNINTSKTLEVINRVLNNFSYSKETFAEQVFKSGLSKVAMPFFVEDRRHVFFVEPNERKWTVKEWDGLGWYVPPIISKVPDLSIFKEIPKYDKGNIDPSPIQEIRQSSISKILPADNIIGELVQPNGVRFGIEGSMLAKKIIQL